MPAKRSVHIREYLLKNMNLVIRCLILSDVIWIGALGLLGPIFALFIVDFIEGGNAAVAGAAASIFLVTKSVLQIPAAAIIDRVCGEDDDFQFIFFGSLAGAIIPILYLFIHTPLQLYAVQFLYGVALAFTFPSYMAIFTRHIDKTREGTEWGIYFTLVDFSSAIAASLGGIFATTIGYKSLIVVVVTVSLLGVFFLYPIRTKLFRCKNLAT